MSSSVNTSSEEGEEPGQEPGQAGPCLAAAGGARPV